MSYARLKLNFTKIADPDVEYLMRTVVNAGYSTPDAIDTCLVVLKGSAGADERLMRVANTTELVTTPLDALPPTVTRFSAPSLASIAGPGIQDGDKITVETPFLWRQFFGASDWIEYTVAASGVVTPTEVIVTSAFPAFGRNLKFYVKQGATDLLPTSGLAGDYPIDGLANRNFSGVSGSYLLTGTHADSWSDLDVANALQVSLRGEAQSLVDALNEDNYSGTSEEIFE